MRGFSMLHLLAPISLVTLSWPSAGWAINNNGTSSSASDANVAGDLPKAATVLPRRRLPVGLLLELLLPRRLPIPRRLGRHAAARHLAGHRVRRALSSSRTLRSRRSSLLSSLSLRPSRSLRHRLTTWRRSRLPTLHSTSRMVGLWLIRAAVSRLLARNASRERWLHFPKALVANCLLPATRSTSSSQALVALPSAPRACVGRSSLARCRARSRPRLFPDAHRSSSATQL